MRGRSVVVAAMSLVAAGSALMAAASGPASFPHARHARLFPLCTGCHPGAAGTADAPLFPRKEACGSCHDGRNLAPVAWAGPPARPSNLRFSHAVHSARLKAQGQTVACASCHTADGAKTVGLTMRDVTGPRPEYCFRCHGHQASAHLDEGVPCRTCHIPLTEVTLLDSARIAAWPRPPGHEAADFTSGHGVGVGASQAAARCAICHARESCQRCHQNGAEVPAIAALGTDPRMARLLAGRAASYPRPASHGSGWGERHGGAARGSTAACANCHVQRSCRACHTGTAAQGQIARLPVGRDPVGSIVTGKDPVGTGTPLGAAAVPLGSTPGRPRVHPVGFADRHGPPAASGSSGCKGCHAESYCSACHAGASRPVFHPANYIVRHGADAYGGARDCGSCHNTESFCKSCHQGSGLAARGRIDVAFHDGQPLWLLQHGEAARKGLEGCVSCHRQQDCTRCHSAAGGWGVNPHGAGFDAGRMSDRNQLVCGRCHVTIPGRP